MPRLEIAPSPLIRAPLGRRADSPLHWYYFAAGGLSDRNGPGSTYRDVFDLITGQVGIRKGTGATPGATFVNGPYGRCLNCDGTGWAVVGSAPVFNVPFTMTCTVNLLDTARHGVFYNVGGLSNGIGLGVGSGDFDTAGNNLILALNGTAWIDSGILIGTGWHTVTVQNFSPINQTIFWIDGRLVFTSGGLTMINPGSSPSSIAGFEPSYDPRIFIGQIADVKFYNYAQRPAEIARDHADPFWRLRPYPVGVEYIPAPPSSVTLAASAGPASTSLGVFTQPPPRMATLAAQAGPATIAWTIDGGSSGPLTIGEFYSYELVTDSATDPWGVDPEETTLLN